MGDRGEDEEGRNGERSSIFFNFHFVDTLLHHIYMYDTAQKVGGGRQLREVARRLDLEVEHKQKVEFIHCFTKTQQRCSFCQGLISVVSFLMKRLHELLFQTIPKSHFLLRFGFEL